MFYTCFTHVLHMFYTCFTYVIHMLQTCYTPVIYVSYVLNHTTWKRVTHTYNSYHITHTCSYTCLLITHTVLRLSPCCTGESRDPTYGGAAEGHQETRQPVCQGHGGCWQAVQGHHRQAAARAHEPPQAAEGGGCHQGGYSAGAGGVPAAGLRH